MYSHNQTILKPLPKQTRVRDHNIVFIKKQAFKAFLYLLACLALLCLLPTARADWSDDVAAIARLMYAGDYGTAEKLCNESLARGPSGLFSNTGTLVIHHWRGRARLVQGNVPGAIEDADFIIRAEGTMFPPDSGYALRGVAKALQGNAAGAAAEFDALAKIDRSGLGEALRQGGFHGERAIARILTDDLDGGDADLAAALALDYGFLGASTMQPNKQAWAVMRLALTKLKSGDQTGAIEAFRLARSTLKPSPGKTLSSDFVLVQLLINKYTSPKSKAPPQDVSAPIASGKVLPGQLSSGSALPGQKSYWGFTIEDTGGQGISLKAVKNDSPAGIAGLQAGDVLLSINGAAVNSVQAFRAVKNTFPFFTPLKLALKRGDTRIEREISLYGITPLKLKPARVDFSIPGIPTPPASTPAEQAINVLDQVVLDPATGRIAVIGHYDQRFGTGPIPYLDLLKTALAYPKPKFDLTDDADLSRLDPQIKNWSLGKELILSHPALEQDRQLLIKAWARSCGLLPEELVALFNYANFSRREVTPPAHIRRVQEKILRNLGFARAAEAYRLVNQTVADAPLKAMQHLGRNAEAQAILNRAGGDAATRRGLLTAAVYLAVLEQIHAPEGEIINLRQDLTQNRRTWQDVVVTAQGSLLPNRSASDSRDLVKMSLNTIMLSARGSRALFPQLWNQDTELKPTDLDRTSQLTRILYEADYSLKSLVVMPHLFRQIPGALSLQEYEIRKGIGKQAGDTKVVTQHWLEPEQISMTVSPGRRLVSFGPARMRYLTKATGATCAALGNDPYAEWASVLTEHYDEYAYLMPAFHKVREAAKILTLANWMIAEKVPVELGGVRQEKWDAPDRVPGFWRVGLSYVAKEDDESIESFQIAYTGGVTFKGQNWTQITPAPPERETAVSTQLALSAGLGQLAAQTAQGGDLEGARHLAELSAQAMIGPLSPTDLSKLKVTVPAAQTVPVSAAGVQLQQALLQQTRQQIEVLGQNPAAATAADALKELNRLYGEMRSKPAAASDYLVMLQTRQTSPPPVSAVAYAQPATESVCGERISGDWTLPAERKAYLLRRLGDTRDRLRYINEALRKLIAINATERDEIEKLTTEISARYEEAQNRAWDVVLDLLTGVSLDGFSAEQVRRLKAIEDAIAAKTALKATPQDAVALRAIDQEIMLLQSAKFRSEEAYAATAQLVDGLKMSKYGKDVGDWQRKEDQERARDGLVLVASLAIDHPWLEKWLGKKAFFASDKLWQVTTMGRMTYYAAGFAYDILAQWAVWEPMTHRMQNDLKYNMQSIERLRLRAEETSKEIGCLETQLR